MGRARGYLRVSATDRWRCRDRAARRVFQSEWHVGRGKSRRSAGRAGDSGSEGVARGSRRATREGGGGGHGGAEEESPARAARAAVPELFEGRALAGAAGKRPSLPASLRG